MNLSTPPAVTIGRAQLTFYKWSEPSAIFGHLFAVGARNSIREAGHFWISGFEKEVYAVGLPQKQMGSPTEIGAKERHDLVAQLCRPIRTLRASMFP